MKLRPEIQRFAEEMELLMSLNDEKKGDSWKEFDDSVDVFLHGKLREEYLECMQEDCDVSEYADLANICMMLWTRGAGLMNQIEENATHVNRVYNNVCSNSRKIKKKIEQNL